LVLEQGVSSGGGCASIPRRGLARLIDTNVYLDFFRFGQDTLDALRKLATAIRDGHVKLWTTEQVRDELRRSREGRVDESLRALDELRPTSRMPSIAREPA
jgi:hypothetical protein